MVVLVVNIFQMKKQTLKNSTFSRSQNKVQSRIQIQSSLLLFSVNGARNLLGKNACEREQEGSWERLGKTSDCTASDSRKGRNEGWVEGTSCNAIFFFFFLIIFYIIFQPQSTFIIIPHWFQV
uniref:Uncharacterized protein n=1 Tax=Pipistrellus kuhlii TaxID=59472 RepID=A0A7J7YMI0_PIPKU|nr:hypothetical protein mPipKuh1_010111 [Pipistrellus kuhlii]